MIFDSAMAMAEAVRLRRISPRELVEAHLSRIAKVNPLLNAVVEIGRDFDFHGGGPLAGVPMTVKGAWDCTGFRNSGGTAGRRDFVAAGDATAIARLRAAGAIPIAVTNLPEFSFAFEADNRIHGRTNNPYDAARTPGGSGGGGAAAIAAGCSPFEAGGDMGGSIRLPCHSCGIAGLKPTLGRVPLTGYFPGPFGPVTMLATAGPMARHVDDLYPLLKLMAGPDGEDANAVDGVLRDPAAVRLGDLRIAFHGSNGVLAPDTEVMRAVEDAARTLDGACRSVEEAMPEGMAGCFDLFLSILGADGGAGLDQLKAESGTDVLSPLVEGFLEILRPRASSGARFGELLVQRDLFRRAVARFFCRYDALICPVNAHSAIPHGESVARLASYSYTMAHNLSGCPGAVVRFGTGPGGLPVGVQVVAAAWREDLALAVASYLENNGGGFRPPAL